MYDIDNSTQIVYKYIIVCVQSNYKDVCKLFLTQNYLPC
jgi:hypothetical protein